ncbi:MAG: mnmH [Flavisolibacter sp.]|nr:mnmH [Flavisolibacter sp.]
MRRTQVEEFLKGSSEGLLLDVRSPSEYNHACIPGAISFPLFTDEERRVVGTAYKQRSREDAIKIGLDYFGPKMRGMVEEVERLIGNKQSAISIEKNCQLPIAKCVFLYCWRGGMRSGAVSWLLNMYGFNVTVLAGGYKAFRNYVLKSFEQPYPFKILGGYTGSGKTEVLQQLQQAGEAVIDLEGLASHKGSAFGSINMPMQPSQEMFENRLSLELLAVSHERCNWPIVNDEPAEITPNPKLQTPNSLWLEDESQRIGNLNIPGGLWQNMRGSPIYFLDIPFEERLQHITEEYSQCEKEKLSDAIERIKKRLGPLETKTALQHLEENNVKECFRILLHYYDKHYLKGLHSRQSLDALLTTIACETVTPKNAFIISHVQVTQ